MAFLKLKIPKQQNDDNRISLEVEEDAIVITSASSFYKIGKMSYWVLNAQGLYFTKSNIAFSSLRLKKR